MDGCIEKLGLTLEESSRLPIVINGFISDHPGPYTIKIKQSFDIGLRNSLERPVSVKQLTISDDQGNQEVLSETSQGTYQTNVSGIRGVVGRAYKLGIELFNGKIYESLPDTLTASGGIDTVYYKFETMTPVSGAPNYSFGIYFDASSESRDNLRFLWKFKGTFKVDTQGMGDEPCSLDIDCTGCSICNLVAKCSGIRNVGTPKDPIFFKFKPCECCTCWYNIFNDEPIISDYQILQGGLFRGVKVGTIPIDDWRLQHKIYAEVSQFSLTRQAHLFFKAIRDQREGLSSLFQPPSGKIPSNFIQTSGKEESILGIFYAASIRSKTIVITKRDVPQGTYEFPSDKTPIPGIDCKKLYPNATTIKPSFWED